MGLLLPGCAGCSCQTDGSRLRGGVAGATRPGLRVTCQGAAASQVRPGEIGRTEGGCQFGAVLLIRA